MADETVAQNENETSVQFVEVVNNGDWFLQSTIENIVSNGIEIGITLNVSGLIISGVLVSGKKYFEEMSIFMKSASRQPDDISSALGDAWGKYTSIYEKPEDAPDGWSVGPVGYVHLMNARFYTAGQKPIPNNQGVLWRGKLSSVDGFFIGNLSVD